MRNSTDCDDNYTISMYFNPRDSQKERSIFNAISAGVAILTGPNVFAYQKHSPGPAG